MQYLHITLHDNDFSIELDTAGRALRNLLHWFGCPDEIDLQVLRVCIQGLLYNAHEIQNLLRKQNDRVKLEDFQPIVEIVDASEIPDWDCGENLYIQLDRSISPDMFFR